jgi:poly(beta-D-mannuronate) C5 epimerase
LFNQDFKGQKSPLLAGDAKAFEGHMLRFNGKSSIAVQSRACIDPKPQYYCGFREKGVFDGDGQGLVFSSAATSECTPAKSAPVAKSATAG